MENKLYSELALALKEATAFRINNTENIMFNELYLEYKDGDVYLNVTNECVTEELLDKIIMMTNGYIKKTSLPYSAEIDLDIIDSNANRKIKTVELILEYTPKDNINKYITNHFEEKSFVDFSLRFKIKSMKLSKE